MNISPFLSVNQSCDDALHWTKEMLSQAGLRPVQTFNLHAARAGLHDCSCPHHGSDECDCQMVVLLVYGKAEDLSIPLNTSPVTLILHGNDGQTWLSIAENSNLAAGAKTAAAIRDTLDGKLPAHTSNHA